MAAVNHDTEMVKPGAPQVPIDRASGDDVMSLVSDRHDPPMQVGAVLQLDVGDDFDPAQLSEAVKRRLTAVPRLRQNLIDVPIGCGRPVWLDFAGFEFDEHFAVVRCPGPINEDSVLDFAAGQLTTRLPRERPLWAATLLIGEGDGRAALVLELPRCPGRRHRRARRARPAGGRRAVLATPLTFPAPRLRSSVSPWTARLPAFARWAGYRSWFAG